MDQQFYKMKKAKNFKLLGTSNKPVELNKIKSKYTVLYFYPKDDTPGCTLETKDFNSFYNKFIKLNCEIYGISKDTIESHLKFKKKYKVKFELLSDENKIAIKEFKVWGKKKFMGKEYEGIHRMTFIVDEKGVITFVFEKVKTKEHSNQILDVI